MRFRTTALFLLALVPLFGCQPQQQATPDTMSRDTVVSETTATDSTATSVTAAHFPCKDVPYPKEVEVFVYFDGKDVSVFPEDAYVYCEDQEVVWETNAEAIEVAFKDDKLPKPDCQGKGCRKNYKGNSNGSYKYTATVTAGGKKYPKDPHVIITY